MYIEQPDHMFDDMGIVWVIVVLIVPYFIHVSCCVIVGIL
jgi:hypothetical protein